MSGSEGGLTLQEVNEHHRKKALAWLEGKPLPQLLVLRNLLVPLQL